MIPPVTEASGNYLFALLRQWKRLLPPLAPLVLFTVTAEVVVRNGWVENYLVPKPSEVALSLFHDRHELVLAFCQTALSAVVGLSLSVICGGAIAMILSLSQWLRRAIFPYAVFFQTVPIIAIAPLLVIWFGYGQPTVIASAFIVSVFPMIASTLLGVESTDRALVELFELYGASSFDRLWRLRIPFSLPYVFSGLRVASGLAVIGAIVGEFIAGSGLGGVVDVARTQQRIDKVFAAILVSALLGLAMMAIVNLLNWYFLRHWHASVQRQ